MELLLGLVKEITASQPILQVFVGGCTMIVIGWMAIRAKADKAHIAPSTPVTVADVPDPILTTLKAGMELAREGRDLLRECRDLLRRSAETEDRGLDSLRRIEGHTDRQADLLDRIEREQAAENRSQDRHKS